MTAKKYNTHVHKNIFERRDSILTSRETEAELEYLKKSINERMVI